MDHSFQDRSEAYLQQHYGFREPLTRLHNQYLWDFYGITFAKERAWVFVSDDGWFYESGYVKEFYEGTSWDHAGDSLGMAQLLEAEAKRLRQTQQILESLGIHLFVVLEPGKEQIYPEHVPANTRYNHEKVISAYDFYRKRFVELGVPFVDVTQWFKQMKDECDYPLFPQTGTHWSNLAAMHVADSLVRFMEQLGDMNLKNLKIGEKYVKTKEPDDDLERLLNLMRPLKKAPNYYAKTEAVDDPTAIRPRLITIGDSFYWNILNHTPFKELFSTFPFWYYFSTSYFDGPDAKVADIDVLDKVMSSDFVMLTFSTPQQYDLGSGFTKRFLLEWCYDDDEAKAAKQATISAIRSNPDWMQGIESRAEQLQQPLDTVLVDEMEYFVKHHPEQCFTALKDDIPAKRSTKARQYIDKRRRTGFGALLDSYESPQVKQSRARQASPMSLGLSQQSQLSVTLRH